MLQHWLRPIADTGVQVCTPRVVLSSLCTPLSPRDTELGHSGFTPPALGRGPSPPTGAGQRATQEGASVYTGATWKLGHT